MGQTLSFPAIDKHSESGGNGRFLYAVTEMQGWRITMEDAHAAVLSLDETSNDENSFFAVYDGHGGSAIAKFAGGHVHKRLISEDAYKEKMYEDALKKAFLGTDSDFLSTPGHLREPSGCTAIAALVAENRIYVANAGDSRSVISVAGTVKALSIDHKPTNDGERARITAAGGYIEYGRVNGNLALSRAIGDFDFKKNTNLSPEKQMITADPEITCHDLTDEDEFIVLACDGIWDCLSSQQVVDFVRLQVSEGKELTEIGEMMCDHCLAPDTTSSGAGIGCDNMTVLIVAILNGRTKEEWYSWINERVKTQYGYPTPSTLPQLYAANRIATFNARKEERARDKRSNIDSDITPGGLFERVLGHASGISFHPGDMTSDGDDSVEDDSFIRELLGLGQSSQAGRSLKERLEEFERDLEEEDIDDITDESTAGPGDLDTEMQEPHPETTNDESPTSPDTSSPPTASESESHSLPNGDARKSTSIVEASPLPSTTGENKPGFFY